MEEWGGAYWRHLCPGEAWLSGGGRRGIRGQGVGLSSGAEGLRLDVGTRQAVHRLWTTGGLAAWCEAGGSTKGFVLSGRTDGVVVF